MPVRKAAFRARQSFPRLTTRGRLTSFGHPDLALTVLASAAGSLWVVRGAIQNRSEGQPPRRPSRNLLQHGVRSSITRNRMDSPTRGVSCIPADRR